MAALVSFKPLLILARDFRPSLCQLLTDLTDRQSKGIETLKQDPIHQHHPPYEGECCQSEELKENDSPAQKHKSEGSAGDIIEASTPVSPFERWKEEKRSGKKAISCGQVFPAPDEASAIDEAHTLCASRPATRDIDRECPQNEAWSLGATHAIPAKAHWDADEAPLSEKCHDLASKEALNGLEQYNKPEGIAWEDSFAAEEAVSYPAEEVLSFPAEEAASKLDPPQEDEATQEDTLEEPLANSVIECCDNLEEQISDPYNKSMQDSVNPYLLQPVADVAPGHSGPSEVAKSFVSPPRSATSSVHRKINADPDPAPAQLSTASSVLEAATPEAPIQDGHTLTLKIINGSKILRSVVFIEACTRSAILNAARAYCVKRGQDDPSLEGVEAKKWDLSLVSLRLDGFDMDMSTYEVDNLSFLVETIERKEVPIFTLRVVEV